MKHSIRLLSAFAVLAVALSAGIANAGLISYWNFDNGISGGQVADLTGNGVPLLISGTLATNPVVAGAPSVPGMKAVDFATTNGGITVASNPSKLNFSGNKFTLSMWLKEGYNTSYPRLWKASTGAFELQGNTYSDGDAVYFKGNNSSWKSTSALNGYRGSWHNVTVTGDGTTLKFYLDGTLKNSQAQPAVTNGWGTLSIASDTTRITGQLGDLAIFNTAETDITGIMNRTNPEIAALVPEPSTVALLLAGLLGLIAFARPKR